MSNSNGGKFVLDIETSCFLPWQGKIILIGVMNVSNKEIRIFQDQDEMELLIRLFKYYEQERFEEIIGFNLPYDLRYIFIKCLQYKIPANGFFTLKQTDIMTILKDLGINNSFNKPGTLDDWAQTILGKKKTFQNHQIPGLYLNNRIVDIIKYNKNDLILTYELWQRIQTTMGEQF
jgi:DNA polymerase elongation subunit (family B)